MTTIIDGISHLDSQELKDILAEPDNQVIVIDVREPEEYEAAHIAGLPLIPMGEIADLMKQMDTSKEYVFLCRSGRRSYEVAKFFSNSGFTKVHNHLGGILAWQQQGLEITSGPADDILTNFTPDQLERKNNQ